MNSMEGNCLKWMQRVSLIRHNLHAALRTGDFTFFKTIQAQAFLDGSDYAATLSSMLDDSDEIIHYLDDLNVGLVNVHQDSFKAVYDSVRSSIAESDERARMAMVRVDISQQKQIADIAIDKIISSAIALIEQQQEIFREAVANVWMVGITIVADALQVCSIGFSKLENVDNLTDFVYLEYTWQDVQTAVEASISALRGILNMMSSASDLCQKESVLGVRRSSSIGSASSWWLRRLSSAISNGMTTSTLSSRRSSISIPNPNTIHESSSAVFPTSMKRGAAIPPHNLDPIPPTPAIIQDSQGEEINPFDLGFQQ
jgi:hypothetical protein